MNSFSIIIPFLEGKRGLKTLIPTIESCLRQKLKPEIIVVSNLENASLESICRETKIAYYCSQRLGVNYARNLGAAKANGEYLYFLDDDCILLNSDHLSKIQQALLTHPEFSAVGGPYLSDSRTDWKVRGYNAMATAWTQTPSLEFKSEIKMVEALLGGNMCVRRSDFSSGFNARIVSGGDEADFFSNLLSSRKQIGYFPDLGVLHLADDSFAGLIGRAKNQGLALQQIKSSKSLFDLLNGLRLMVQLSPASVPFSLIHFMVLWYYKICGSPKLTEAIENMRDYKK